MQMKNPIFKVCFSLSFRFLLVLLLLAPAHPALDLAFFLHICVLFSFCTHATRLSHPEFKMLTVSWTIYPITATAAFGSVCLLFARLLCIFFGHINTDMHTYTCSALDTSISIPSQQQQH